MRDNLVLITGCSGGGKSSLLDRLRARGHRVVEEPGRRVVRTEQAQGGSALPWIDLAAFLRRALALAQNDLDAARGAPDFVFFDRGVIDAASGLEELTGAPVLRDVNAASLYRREVFLAPPWPEIFANDPERRHGFDDATREYRRLADTLPRLGYTAIELPKTTPEARADFVLSMLRR
ncbi:MAG: AAA family ATPase [Alphaproteobacteria bacterium]|nr:AAA family ATPase [Alphaproteobacteria bacterium]